MYIKPKANAGHDLFNNAREFPLYAEIVTTALVPQIPSGMLEASVVCKELLLTFTIN